VAPTLGGLIPFKVSYIALTPFRVLSSRLLCYDARMITDLYILAPNYLRWRNDGRMDGQDGTAALDRSCDE